ncbi:MAG: hypothetical protein ACI80V_002763 [Rhodothermales bacterium]|jgi:hypothetical protein
MTFLNPLILLGLMVAAVPLIIHLFNFRKPRKVDFSSLAFLREVERSTMRRVRIKQWLLLALRTLAIAAMVLAFARPTLRGRLAAPFAGAAPVAVAVIIDNSPSMQQRNAGGSYFDQALLLAKGIVGDTDTRDEVVVIPVQSRRAASFGPGGESALDRIQEVEITGGGRSLLQALAAAGDAIKSAASTNREIYVLSDLQRSTLVDSSEARVTGDVPVYVVQVGEGTPDNIGVRGAIVRSRIIEAEQPVRLSAQLTNHGLSDAASYVTSVYLDGDRVAQTSSDLSPGTTSVVEFSVSPSSRGWLEGIVETEDDGFPEDNRAYFALRVPEERSILLVAGEDQDTRFVDAALRADPRVSLRLRTVPESQLPALDLSEFDVVVLVGPATLSSGEIDRIRSYVDAGGGVLLFPSESGRVADYNALFSAVGAGRVVSLPDGAPSESIDTVDRVDLEHPVFDGVLDASAGGLERPEIFQRMVYRPGSGTESTVMELSSGSPFLQEIRRGRGTLLVLAVAPTPSWSDLPTRGLFIPLLYRSIFLLSSSEGIEGDSFSVGDAAEVLLPGVTESFNVQLVSPAGLEASPVSRAGAGGRLISLEGLIPTPGHYRVLVDGAISRIIAVNAAAQESDLALSTSEEAVQSLGQRADGLVQALNPTPGTSTIEQIADTRRGADLWNVFLALALLFLAAEMVVAKAWKPETT